MTNGIKPLVPISTENLEDTARALLQGVPSPAPSSGNSQVNASINPREYIQIPNVKGLFGEAPLISAYELQGYNGLKYNDTHFKLFDNGLYMPSPKVFMTHFANVVNSFQGKTKLFYADSSEVPKSEIQEMYKHLTTNYKDIYGKNNPGVWTWLNAFFKEGKIMHAIAAKNKQLVLKEESLEACLKEDTFADFRKLNSQGLPLPIAKKGDSYIQGENIKFWYPREGAVARFYADSGRALLYCDGAPASSDSSLGVFACAQKI